MRYKNKTSLFLVLFSVVIIASIAYQYSLCDGTFVRTLFGFECLEGLK